jgi:hypothetical protein
MGEPADRDVRIILFGWQTLAVLLFPLCFYPSLETLVFMLKV